MRHLILYAKLVSKIIYNLSVTALNQDGTFYLSGDAAIKRLESPSVYHIPKDELYELDEEAIGALYRAAGPQGAALPQGEFLGYCLDEGILATTGPRAPHPPIEQAPLPSLRYLELQVTDRCNLRCAHCYLGAGGKTDLPVASIAKVLEEFQRMQGLRVMLTGGEPTLHPQFDAINAILPRYACRFVLFTNGTLMSPQRLESLNVQELQVSIDGMRAGHEAIRGAGSYDRAMSTVREALKLGMQVSVSTMIHRHNLAEFDGMDELFKALGVRDWTVDAPTPEGALKENPRLALSPGEAGPYFRFGFGAGLHGGGDEGEYSCGRHLMAVTAGGRCAKCMFYEPVGDIAQGLATSWARVPQLRLDALMCDCGHLEQCRGGCRFRASALGGGPTSKDLYKCGFYDKIKHNDCWKEVDHDDDQENR